MSFSSQKALNYTIQSSLVMFKHIKYFMFIRYPYTFDAIVSLTSFRYQKKIS